MDMHRGTIRAIGTAAAHVCDVYKHRTGYDVSSPP